MYSFAVVWIFLLLLGHSIRGLLPWNPSANARRSSGRNSLEIATRAFHLGIGAQLSQPANAYSAGTSTRAIGKQHMSGYRTMKIDIDESRCWHQRHFFRKKAHSLQIHETRQEGTERSNPSRRP